MNKKVMLWLLLPIAIATTCLAIETSAPVALAPQSPQQKEAVVAAQLLQSAHYKPVPLDRVMSGKVFDRYLKTLDPERIYFIQSDIDKFAASRETLGDAIMHQDLSTPYAIFNLFETRVYERLNYSRELLKQSFDFSTKESFVLEREKEPWPKTQEEANDLWRKRVKNDWLRLKLAGKDDAAIRETLAKRYESNLARVSKFKSDEVFDIFMDSYATSIDPHTNYLGAKQLEEFNISMKLSLFGIGAVLQNHDDYTVIREIVPGTPAGMSGKLQVGDRIVGVAQGIKAPMVEVVGWRNDDVVSLIRGPQNTVVVLDILPADAGVDGKHKQVVLTRAKISLERQAAKKTVMVVKDGDVSRKIGVISLPAFYQDFEAFRHNDADYRSATRDVAKLLAELKKENVDSVLIDLRNNGGGSLDEAVDLTGLFIGRGPVVQQRDSHGQVSQRASDKPPVWDGPMGVLINRGSASASEIFAAAIQDYGRGLIIGEASFGKGTVQSVAELSNWLHDDKAKTGAIKLTIAQFFRVNGGTTQLRGVAPDITLATTSDAALFGESTFDNALPWSQVRPADYVRTGDVTDILPILEAKHESRIAKDKDYQYLLETLAFNEAQRKKNEISLNEAERRKERDAFEARQKAHERAVEADKGKKPDAKDTVKAKEDDGLQFDERSLKAQIEQEKESKEAKDVLLLEAIHVLGDEVGLLKTNAKLAARVLPMPLAHAGAQHD